MELALFKEPEKTMTTRELAESLKVSNVAIMRVLEKTNNLNGTVKVENGKTTLFTEIQAVQIKQELQKHHNLASRQIDSVSSELEENQTIMNAFSILQRRNTELKMRAEKAEHQLEEQKPKVEAYDDFISRDGFCNFRDAAKYLGISQSDFMKLLKSKYIYQNSIGEYRAYSEYSNLFILRPFDKGYNRIGQQLMMKLNGVQYLKNKITNTIKIN